MRIPSKLRFNILRYALAPLTLRETKVGAKALKGAQGIRGLRFRNQMKFNSFFFLKFQNHNTFKEPRMSKANATRDQNGQHLLALLILILVPSIGVLVAMGETRREYLHTFLFVANRGAFFTTLVTILGYIALFSLLLKKKAGLITSDLKDAFASFKEAEKIKISKPLLLAPQLALFGCLSLCYLVSLLLGKTAWQWLDATRDASLSDLRLALDALTWVAPFPLIAAVVTIFLNRTGLSKLWRKRLLEGEERDAKKAGLLPPPPPPSQRAAPTFLLGARESKASKKFEPDARVPSWVEYGSPEIFGGMCVFGMKGSGKTQLILRLIEQSLAHKADDPSRKMSLCVIDVKGDLTEFIKRKAKALGRENDVVHLGVETTSHWNPIGHLSTRSRFSECRQVGYFLRSAMSVGGGQGGDNNKYWEDNADNLCARSLHLLALAGHDVNFSNVYSYVTQASSSDKHSIDYRQRIYELAKNNSANDPVLSEELKETREYFEEEFVKLDSKVRTIVVNVASNFLQKFISTEYKISFGRKTTEPHHFSGFRELIANGGVFVLDIRSNEHGTIANAIATLVKLNYMAAVKTRDHYKQDKGLRKTVLVCDEYQSYVTPSSSQAEGDDKYLETSRSFGAIDIFSTQQLSSIVAVCGEGMTSRIMGNFNTVVVFKHNDPRLTKYLSELAGTEEVTSESISIQEGSSTAKRHPLTDDEHSESDHSVSRSVSLSKREKNLIDPNLFKSLTQFEAVGMIDGFGERRLIRFYTKPIFCELRTPHKEVMRIIEEANSNEAA